MTRRQLIAALSAAKLPVVAGKPKLSVEGYIFQQYAQSKRQPLASVLPEVIPMARAAGFQNIELNSAFFPPEERQNTLTLLRAHGLRMPSVYVGGSLHEKEGAARTLAAALELGALCAPFGCGAIVNNPNPKPNDLPKTDAELAFQADSLNAMGARLARHGLELRVHHHTPQLADNAREWRHILAHTDPRHVHLCVDVDWAYEAGFDPVTFLAEAGLRVRELHLRSAKNKVWMEDLEDSDIDYRAVAGYLRNRGLTPLLVVELAYRPATVITRTLSEDLRLSRVYAENVFGVKADE